MIILAERASKPLVGSSRKRTLGWAASSTPIVKRFICSTELPRMILSAMLCISKRSRHSFTESYFLLSGTLLS
ncbi:hypothetical protein PC116_g33065 [Phytophthora cactorum]|nr:hypothetical protein PC116_g33065 [Phytophthora cactorum]